MSQLKPNTKLKAHIETFSLDDENRIDWDRRKLKKKESVSADNDLLVVEVESTEETVFYPLESVSHKKKQKRDKRRQLVMDEESGRVTVKRRRKGRRNSDEWQDYD